MNKNRFVWSKGDRIKITRQPNFADAIRLLSRLDADKSFVRLAELLNGATPETVRAAEAAFEAGSAWGAAGERRLNLEGKGRPAVDDATVFYWIQVAAEKFLENPKHRNLKPHLKDIVDNWDRTCGFAITPQRFAAWRKSGVGFVFAGPRFRFTCPR